MHVREHCPRFIYMWSCVYHGHVDIWKNLEEGPGSFLLHIKVGASPSVAM